MQRNAFVLVLLALCACSSPAPPAARVLEKTPIGAEFHYDVGRVRHTDLSPELAARTPPAMLHTMNFEVRGQLTVKLRAVSATGYDVLWQAQVSDSRDASDSHAADVVVARLHEFRLNLPLHLRVDLAHERAALQVRNAAQLRPLLFAKVRELVADDARQLLHCQDESTLSKCALLHGDDDALASKMLRAAEPLFACSGRKLNDAHMTQWTDRRRSPDGLIDIPLHYSVLERATDAQGAVHMRLQATTDDDSMRAIIGLPPISTDNPQPAPDLPTKLQWSETTDCALDGSDGWPLHVEQSERVVSAGYEAIETVRFDRR